MPFDIPDNDLTTYDDQSRWYSTDIAILTAALGGVGVLSGCAVTAQGVPDMTVAVAAGSIRDALGAATAVTAGNVTIGAAHATLHRIDLITAAASGTKTITAGTAAASPKPPALPAGHIGLAMVYVPATTTAITTALITDKRCVLAPTSGGLADLVTGNDSTFAASLGNWTGGGGTRTRDTGTKLTSLLASLKHVTNSTNQYIELPITGTFEANKRYVAILLIAPGTAGITATFSFGLIGTDATVTGAAVLDGFTDGLFVAVAIPWIPTANRTGVVLRMAIAQTAKTYYVGWCKVLQAPMAVDLVDSQQVYTPLVIPNGVATAERYEGLWGAAERSYGGAVAHQFRSADGGSELVLGAAAVGAEVYGKGVAGDLTNTGGVALIVGNDALNLRITERTSVIIQQYADGYDVELVDTFGMHWLARSEDDTVRRYLTDIEAVTRRHTYVSDECYLQATGNVLAGGVAGVVSGAAAAISAAASTASHPGIIQLTTGTDTTGRCALAGAASGVILGGGKHRVGVVAKLDTLSDGTDTYTVRIGLGDDATAESTDFVGFRYTHGVNAGEWQGVCRSNGTESTLDTNIVANTAYHTFEVMVNAAGTLVTFYIDGTSVGTISTNIPTGAGRETGFLPAYIQKSAGTTARTMQVDAYWYLIELTTPR